jgi:hypothetical protein
MSEWTRDIPGRDGPFIPDESLPEVVRKYLVRAGVVALSIDQYRQLYDAAYTRNEKGCPYPLHTDPWGHPNHHRYVGRICEKEGDFGAGLSVVQCEACGNVTFETPVAIG